MSPNGQGITAHLAPSDERMDEISLINQIESELEARRRVLALISPEESGLESLVRGLAARKAPLPTARVAVVLGQHHGRPR